MIFHRRPVARSSTDGRLTPKCHPIVGRWTAAEKETKQIVLLGDRWLLFSGADQGIFVGGGGVSNLPQKIEKAKKKI